MSGINFNPGSGNPLGGLLGLPGNGKPQLPGGVQPPGLEGPGGPDVGGPDMGLPGTGGPDGLPNPNSGLPGGDSPFNPGMPNSPLPGTGANTPLNNSPLLNPDNPASRLLQGQSPQTTATNAFNNSPTQYPAPTLSERALNGAAQYAQLDRSANLGAVPPTLANTSAANLPGQALPQSSGMALASNGAASGAASNAAAAAATTSNAAPTLTLIATNTSVAVPAAPMAGSLSQEALNAQQSLFARMNTLQQANVPGHTAANAPPPPSETPATLQSVNTNTIANDPRSLPLTGNERAVQQRGDGPPNTLVYTGDGATRRTQRRGGRVDNATLTHWLWNFGRGGTHRPTHEAEPALEMVRALQWLFWVLTVVAYACLAMAVILMLPAGSLVSDRVGPAGSGVALFLGVVVAAGAWWLGRRLNHGRDGASSDP